MTGRSSASRLAACARCLPVVAMLAGTALLYLPAGIGRGATLLGLDYGQLHRARLEYAIEALRGGSLPGWFTRELLGAPFLANVANLPWIPSHLVLLAWDPAWAYLVAVVLSALLTAGFTFLFCREVGIGRSGSALAGFTFAASGFFASRVLAGQLTLIEGLPALPLLLWLVERAHRRRCRRGAWSRASLLAVAAAAACAALAGHPQLPAYALATASVYALCRGRGGARLVAAMAAGAALTFVVWLPMLLLVGESARALGLPTDPLRSNDIAFPWWRLDAFVRPWADGWPAPIPGTRPFAHANVAYFWDTVCYVGLAPLAAGLALALDAARRRRAPSRPAWLMAGLGAAALVLALPWVEALWPEGPILLRSPSRQVYVTVFALCAALGAGADRLLRVGGRAGWILVILLAVAHVGDVATHARAFVQPERPDRALPATLEAVLADELGDGRLAVSVPVYQAMLRDRDRVGFYDATPLARPFLALHRLEGGRPVERELVDGSLLSGPTLAALGVRFVVTTGVRRDLPLRAAARGIRLYRVPRARRRVAFFPLERVDFVARPLDLEPARLAEGPPRLRLADGAPRPGDAEAPGLGRPVLRTRRPSVDRIEIDLAVPAPGYVRVLESWSEGWSARVDGRRAPVLQGDGFSLAIPVEAGSHRVELRYATPGRGAGWLLSGLSVLALAGIVAGAGRGPRRRGPAAGSADSGLDGPAGRPAGAASQRPAW